MGVKHPFVVARPPRVRGAASPSSSTAALVGVIALGFVTQWISEKSAARPDGLDLSGRLLIELPVAWTAPAQWLAVWLVAAALVVARQRRGSWAIGLLVVGLVLFVVSIGPLYVPGSFVFWMVEEPAVAWPARIATASLALLGFLAIYWSAWRGETVPNLHGSARFAETTDLRESGLLDGRGGIAFGWERSRGRWRPLRHSGVEHVLVLGETRAGKTSEQLVPTLLDWDGHVVIGDFKDGELFEVTAGALAERGFRVIRFDPLGGKGVPWNPLLEIEPGEGEVGELATLAEALIPLDPKGTEHFPKAARELFLGLALHVLYAEPPGRRSIGAVRSLLLEGLADPDGADGDGEEGQSGAGKGLYRLFERLAKSRHDRAGTFGFGPDGTHPEVQRIARGMLETPEKELGSIGSTLRQALQPWADPMVDGNMRRSMLKLGRVRRDPRRTAIYMTVPLAELDRLASLVRLFVVAAAKRLTSIGGYVDQAADHRGLHRALMVLEEFPALGKVDYVSRMLSTVGGYGLTMVLCVQTLSQLKTIYGTNEPISGGCPVKVVNSTMDLETMKAVSTWSGEMTIVRSKVSRSHSGKSGSSATRSEEEVKRPLLTTGEVGALPKGRGVVFYPSCPPILSWKRGYYRVPKLLARTRVRPPRATETLVDPLCPWDTEQPARARIFQPFNLEVSHGT